MKLELETERLKIRNLRESDLNDFVEYRSDPDVVKYQDFEVMDKEEALSFILKQKDIEPGDLNQWQQFGIILKSNNKLIGDCAVKIEGKDVKTAELGCTVSKKFQNKGYAKETFTALINFLFSLRDVKHIVAITDVENIASIKLIEAVGFKQGLRAKKDVVFKGKAGSEYHYIMDKD